MVGWFPRANCCREWGSWASGTWCLTRSRAAGWAHWDCCHAAGDRWASSCGRGSRWLRGSSPWTDCVRERQLWGWGYFRALRVWPQWACCDLGPTPWAHTAAKWRSLESLIGLRSLEPSSSLLHLGRLRKWKPGWRTPPGSWRGRSTRVTRSLPPCAEWRCDVPSSKRRINGAS